MNEFVVLVTPEDQEIGEMEKLQAHKMGLLHRAFSVFVFNEDGEILLQQRALSKYHSPGQWTNSCCSHPRKDEAYNQAAMRRMKEELGLEIELKPAFSFIYYADVGKGLYEHELDHVFTGKWSGEEINFNPKEVMAIRWIHPKNLDKEIRENPENFTPWFRIIWEKHLDSFKTKINLL